ncbi:MAG: hypothetical protein KDD43_00170 [Bdellovibrionales bacterium]|nr:hypothetical protein [Bdellovibrionales bacterium]
MVFGLSGTGLPGLPGEGSESPPPKITLGGVPLDIAEGGQIGWTMLTGPQPNRETFEVTEVVSEQLSALENPVSLYMEVSQGRGEKVKKVTAQFDKIYLTEVKTNFGFTQTWQITDRRFLWEGLKIYRMYNIQWGGYEQRQLLGTSSDRRFADYETIQDIRYAKWSLKDPGSNGFLVPSSDTTEKGEVWTAKQILLDLLINAIGLDQATDIEDKLADNEFQPENLIFDMIDPYSALQTVLAMCHGNMYQRPDGKIEIYSLDESDDIMEAFLYDFSFVTGSEVPFKTDLGVLRPGKIRVGFEKLYSILFKYSEDGEVVGTGTVERGAAPELDLENVLPLPDTFTVNGKKYVRGTIIPIFTAISLWNNDPVSPPPGGKALTKLEIRRRWCTENYLESLYGTYILKGIPRADEVWSNRIAALRQHYRRTYRVNQFWAQRTREFKAEASTLLDPITGQKQPSPVWFDYTQIATYRQLMKSKNPSAHVAAKVIRRHPDSIPQSFFNLKTFENAPPAPAEVRMINPRLGLFQIVFLDDPAFYVMRNIMGEVTPVPKVAAGLSQDLTLWGRVSLKSGFKLAALLSCLFAVPNSNKSKHFVEFDVKDGNKDRVFELNSIQDNARYRYSDDMKVVFSPDGDVFISGAEIDNEEVIEAIAKGEAEQVKFSWTDRVHTGTFTAPEWEAQWVPFGWISSVNVSYSKGSGLRTTISMTEPASITPLLNRLSPKVRHILQKSVLSRDGI